MTIENPIRPDWPTGHGAKVKTRAPANDNVSAERLAAVKAAVGAQVSRVVEDRGQFTLVCKAIDAHGILSRLRDELRFEVLADLTAVDYSEWPDSNEYEERFGVVVDSGDVHLPGQGLGLAPGAVVEGHALDAPHLLPRRELEASPEARAQGREPQRLHSGQSCPWGLAAPKPEQSRR